MKSSDLRGLCYTHIYDSFLIMFFHTSQQIWCPSISRSNTAMWLQNIRLSIHRSLQYSHVVTNYSLSIQKRTYNLVMNMPILPCAIQMTSQYLTSMTSPKTHIRLACKNAYQSRNYIHSLITVSVSSFHHGTCRCKLMCQGFSL